MSLTNALVYIMDRFDVILDCSGQDDSSLFMSLLKPWSNAKYVTLTGPLLKNMNSQGIAFGSLSSVSTLLSENVKSYQKRGNSYRWAYFAPMPTALDFMREMVEQGEVRKFT